MSHMSKLDSLLTEAESHTKALLSCMSDVRDFFSNTGKDEAKPESKTNPVPEEKLPIKEEVRADLSEL